MRRFVLQRAALFISLAGVFTMKFATCDLCDAFKDDTSDAVRVLPPVFQHYGAVGHFAGPVRTVQCFEDNTLVKQALDSPGDGAVLVVDGGALCARLWWAGIWPLQLPAMVGRDCGVGLCA